MDTLDALFAAAVAAHRDRPAIDAPPRGAGPRRVLTYAELDRLADAIAARIPSGRPDAAVLLMLPRGGIEVYASQLATTRLGRPFCSTDAAYPDAHLRAVIADVAPHAILTDAPGVRRLASIVEGVPILDATTIAADPGVPAIAPRSRGESLAYLISTSGTTGTPKAVMITHRGITNLVTSDLRRYGLAPGDRVAQCSSTAFDSSVEETWLALACGATLVPIDDEVVRSGPDLPAWLRRERITVFCPPPTLLRAMAVEDPRRELPQLRLVYVGGEALPQDLSDLWSAAVWLENGYGPTECTVTATRARMRPGVPVHVGEAVEGNEAFVVGEDGREVPPLAEGELCIAGVGVSPGYLGRPEETARRFGPIAGRARAYRTGDLVRRRAGGEIEYLGRLDAQVKVRGVRIELGAVETCLAAHPAVLAAACAAVGEGTRARLGAAVVVRPEATLADPTRVLAAWARERLPAGMVPALVVAVDAIPTAVSGKTDRRAVAAALAAAAPRADARGEHHEAIAGDATRSPSERVQACMARVLGLPEPPAPTDDFFTDLGGDSLRAVELLLLIRRVIPAEGSVRDLYAGRTAEGIAARLALHRVHHPRAWIAPNCPRSPAPVAVVQAMVLLVGFVLSGGVAYAAIFLLLPWAVREGGPMLVALLLPVASYLLSGIRLPLGIAATLLAKAILVGRYEPGRVEAWSGRHLREWTVAAVASWIPWGVIEGTELHAWTLRRLGARIGRRVDLHRGVRLARGGWDLVEIGDDAILERDARLLASRLHRGGFEWGTIRIGAGAVVGIRATLEPGSTIGERAEVEPLALVAGGMSIPAGRRWGGVPAVDRGVPPPLPAPQTGIGPWRHAILVILGRFLSTTATVLLVFLAGLLVAGLDLGSLQAWLEDPRIDLRAGLLACAAGVLAVPLWLVATALAMRWIAPLAPGEYPRHGLVACRIELRQRTLDAAGRWISGTLFWPAWLRLAGMRIGRGSEVSTIIDTLPETTSIGQGSFLADGIYLGAPTTRGGVITVASISLGADTFLGNHAVVPAGRSWPDGMFVGVATVPPPDAGVGEGWFGTPPMKLPRREVVAIDRRLTHEPGVPQRLTRGSWEVARVLVATPPTAVALAWVMVVERAHAAVGGWATALLWAPLASMGGWLALVLFGLAAKWALLGRVRPGMHGLWSCWCSRWDYLYVLWWFSARAALDRLEGTPFLNLVLRLAGTRIGRGVLIGPGATQIVDPDMLRFDDRATVACHFQAHTFEDRVLKIDRVRIGADANAGENAVVMLGAEVGAGATLSAGSVLMKRGEVPPGTTAGGSPIG